MKCQKSEFFNKSFFCDVLVVFLVAFLLTATPIHAGVGEGPYLTLTGSINILEDMDLTEVTPELPSFIQSFGSYLQMDLGLGFNHSVGYSFGSAFSMEVEYSSQGGKMDRACASGGCGEILSTAMDGDIETKSLMVNAIHFFNSTQPLSPYVGYGVGTAFHEATLDGYDDGTETTFAYQFKTGLDLKLNQHINLLMGYRFFTTDQPNYGFFKLDDITIHSLEAGIKYFF